MTLGIEAPRVMVEPPIGTAIAKAATTAAKARARFVDPTGFRMFNSPWLDYGFQGGVYQNDYDLQIGVVTN